MVPRTKAVMIMIVVATILFASQLGTAGYTKIIGDIVGDVTWKGNDISDAYLANGSNFVRNDTGTINGSRLASRTLDNQTGSRALNASYTSSSLRPTMVIATINVSVGNTAGTKAYVNAYTGSTTKASGPIGIVSSQNSSQMNMQVMFVVPASTTYSINASTSTGGVVTLNDWREVLVN